MNGKRSTGRRVMRIAATLAGIAIFAVLIAFAGGFLPRREKVEPGRLPPPERRREPARIEKAAGEAVPVWYEAVGTVESRTTATVSSQISAAVGSVSVDAGTPVSEGQLLLILDDRELQARKRQAEGAVAAAEAGMREFERSLEAAEAAFAQAKANRDRVRRFHDQGVSTDAELEAAESQFLQAQATVARAQAGIERAKAEAERARQTVREADVALGYARVVSPNQGEVARRLVDPGDLAWPGRPLVIVHDRKQLRLRAAVREGLWGQVRTGMPAHVSIPAIGEEIEGTIDEVEPAADPRSRSFAVKVPLPENPGIYPGMFGRLRVRLGERPAVLVPKEMIAQVGQLSTILVRSGDEWVLRCVRTGAEFDGRIEVLAGLAGGEEIGS